jgi:hypothetical protein
VHYYCLKVCRKGQFVSETNGHLRMFQHVRVVDRAERILICVDVAAGILKGTFDDERRRIAGFRCTRMVRASVSAFGLDVGNGAVLTNVSSRSIWI